MQAEGIFRISGEQIDIVALKNEFDSASDPNSVTFPNGEAPILPHQYLADPTSATCPLYSDIDVHSVSGLLKMFFRELSPPLMTFELYSEFMSASNQCSISKLKDLLARLPTENYMYANSSWFALFTLSFSPHPPTHFSCVPSGSSNTSCTSSTM